MAANRSAGRIGLIWKSSMPAARHRSRSSFRERAVKAMMGRGPPWSTPAPELLERPGNRPAQACERPGAHAGVALCEAEAVLPRPRTRRGATTLEFHAHDHLALVGELDGV